MAVKTVSQCVECSYPLAAEFAGQEVSCPMCSTINEAISGVEIPTPIFAGSIGLVLGIFLGPAMLAGSEWGRNFLAKKARGG